MIYWEVYSEITLKISCEKEITADSADYHRGNNLCQFVFKENIDILPDKEAICKP